MDFSAKGLSSWFIIIIIIIIWSRHMDSPPSPKQYYVVVVYLKGHLQISPRLLKVDTGLQHKRLFDRGWSFLVTTSNEAGINFQSQCVLCFDLHLPSRNCCFSSLSPTFLPNERLSSVVVQVSQATQQHLTMAFLSVKTEIGKWDAYGTHGHWIHRNGKLMFWN